MWNFIFPFWHSMAYSAIELYQLFYAILRTFVNSIEYHFEFYRILAAGEFGVEPIDVVVFNVQAVMSLDGSRYSLQPRMLEILEWVHQDPKYYSFMLRVAESTPLMSRVQQDCLTNMTDFERFVQSLQLDNPEATHANIVNSLNEFIETLRNGKYLVLRRILEDEWRTALAGKKERKPIASFVPSKRLTHTRARAPHSCIRLVPNGCLCSDEKRWTVRGILLHFANTAYTDQDHSLWLFPVAVARGLGTILWDPWSRTGANGWEESR